MMRRLGAGTNDGTIGAGTAEAEATVTTSLE